MTKIVVTGSECTGKSTLARQLALHYGTVCSPEYLREYASSINGELTEADIDPIVHGQIAAEDDAAKKATGLLICDTDIFTSVVYNHHYYGQCPAWIETAAHERRADLYLLMDVDLPWQADGQRDCPHLREQMHRKFYQTLSKAGCRIETISGQGETRLACATRAIDAWLAGKTDTE